jgi:hypothetical protein
MLESGFIVPSIDKKVVAAGRGKDLLFFIWISLSSYTS